ncbi:hypothetical protein N781_15080 [Pontibacillus halophilus JSM 076056 = DSM 19796]|uniref:DUF418 domain-containing protein n=1 Tax=Pontibacillus halophilus JSM 076056 = DSM 19796 TaxID=1385510 RepID=A0A0A5I9Y3_9BACI|nr:DUF418 domain-containing protein [Pontibacillus halophilus]KGX92642.1 hypothetical protein N781_15080 [Pontibacillus halophilus JSM 076056 = DSM 19796]
MKTTPLASQKRLPWIDAARGFAIFGIFMVNMPSIVAPFFLYGGGASYFDSTTDEAVQNLVDLLFQASFYTLFSFLFGFGLQLMKDRLSDKGIAYRKVLLRRQLILIGFGIIHAFFIWHGDILLSYGVLGLLLFLFYERKDKVLIWTAILVLGFMSALNTLGLYLIRSQLPFVSESGIEQSFAAYGEGGIGAAWQQNVNDWLVGNGSVGQWVNLALTLVPMFLIGMFFARKRLFHEVGEHRRTLWKIWWFTLVLFVAFKGVPFLFGNPIWFQYYAQDLIGGSASAIFYATSIVLLYQTRAKKGLVWFTYVGKLSLTNYILQSVLAVGLAYNIGFGLYGELTPLMSAGVVVVIYMLQVLGSWWWVHRYHFGPLEWVWRTLTYGSRPKMARQRVEMTTNYTEKGK